MNVRTKNYFEALLGKPVKQFNEGELKQVEEYEATQRVPKGEKILKKLKVKYHTFPKNKPNEKNHYGKN